MMNDKRYLRGKIYRLYSPSQDIQYIGSTIDHLSKRLGGHKAKYKGWKNGKDNYITSFELQ